MLTKDIEFLQAPAGLVCMFCSDKEGLDPEEFAWAISEQMVLTCVVCGTTNEEEK